MATAMNRGTKGQSDDGQAVCRQWMWTNAGGRTVRTDARNEKRRAGAVDVRGVEDGSGKGSKGETSVEQTEERRGGGRGKGGRRPEPHLPPRADRLTRPQRSAARGADRDLYRTRVSHRGGLVRRLKLGRRTPIDASLAFGRLPGPLESSAASSSTKSALAAASFKTGGFRRASELNGRDFPGPRGRAAAFPPSGRRRRGTRENDPTHTPATAV
ncbi:hypothetical protein THAOC_33245, partial [Thalassiosira oceanica]